MLIYQKTLDIYDYWYWQICWDWDTAFTRVLDGSTKMAAVVLSNCTQILSKYLKYNLIKTVLFENCLRIINQFFNCQFIRLTRNLISNIDNYIINIT